MYKAINGFTKSNILETIESKFSKVSIDSRGLCQYRGENNAKCAVGIFIPDEVYCSTMENKGIGGLLWHNNLLISLMPLETEALIELQEKHDKYRKSCLHSEDKKQVDADCKSELLAWVNCYVTE